MQPSSCKAKGRRLQCLIAGQIKDTFDFPADDVFSVPMGVAGEDIRLSERAREAVFDFSFECKNQEKVNVWNAWQQACANAAEHKPAVIIKRNHSEVLCIARWADILTLLKEVNNNHKGHEVRERLPVHATEQRSSEMQQEATEEPNLRLAAELRKIAELVAKL